MIIPHRPAGTGRVTTERKPDFGFARRKHLRRHDPDDRVKLPGKIERPAETSRIALEQSLPQLITQNHERRSTLAILFFGEHSAELRLDPDHREEVRGHDGTGYLFRLAAFESA